MKEKDTDDLSRDLMENPNIDSYISNHEFDFSDLSVTELLTAIYQKKSISKAALARKAGISEVYLHQVFADRKSVV